MRKTIYISERRNKAIADFISSVPSKDVSYEAVKLMEDGMKWRGRGNDVDKEVLEQRSNVQILPDKAASSPVEEKKEVKADFSGIKLERKKLDRGDLEKKFNDL